LFCAQGGCCHVCPHRVGQNRASLAGSVQGERPALTCLG
jgi:hypothetical protein